MAIDAAGDGMMKLGLGLVTILLVAATCPAGAGERMIMKVTPAVAFAPANLVVRAVVEADADNRAIAVIAESEDFYRSSEIQLDGDHAPRTSVFEFRSLPSGNYSVKAMLMGRGNEPLLTLRQQVNVMVSGGCR
jgi:hypothetical protein